MALSGEELDRRVKAAAALYGLTKRQVRDQLHAFGARKLLAEDMVTGKTQQSPKHIRDLAEALGMPQSWFTEEDWRTLILEAPETGTDLAEGARARAAAVLSKRQQQSPGKLRATHRNSEGA